ncbi:BadF/BadG/BcrA/BcrD ATPase family protein [Janthinobacterium fluminis]|uniref:BadF/BadG/BcrA/BcrD ATPase family protein n=1 Tax=Janthinobacterium fluminis TaxID=2987524 RepID=A0ABT5JXH4_9BURK|nr:BadF/BadG/BcrA/BcrD ATPase family protein [Janthinobacterium fluminis]MDC8757427.1 BadF/BadG/BcrA/BcrD ATPase family protein [Janthinobacterium fluminis]
MIDYHIGVDGGGSGTRVRLSRADGSELAQGQNGPSGLAHGIDQAWVAVGNAVLKAFSAAGIAHPPLRHCAIGLGLAGVHNCQWATKFLEKNPGYAAIALESDALTTLLGAHQGQPGAVVAIGTGSVGEVLDARGERREVGGWGFPSGDEAGGAWIGMRAVGHAQQVADGRAAASAFASTVLDACGGHRDAFQGWLAAANQTAYAQLARLVLEHAADDPTARAILAEAGAQVALIAAALDPSGQLPVALCGGLAEPLRAYLPEGLLARVVPAHGDSAAGALRLIRQHLREHPPC